MSPALRLTGESPAVRQTALKELRALANLNPALKQALYGKDKKTQALALDVIAALSLDEFIDDLMGLKDDGNGQFYLTLNALLNSDNRQKIVKHYLDVVKDPGPLVEKVIALDTLSRMEVNLPRTDLEGLLRAPEYEIRSATLSYIRSLLIRFPRKEDIGLLSIPLADHPYQLRIQAIQAIRDLPPSLEIDGLFLLESCRNDPHTQVRKACGGKI